MNMFACDHSWLWSWLFVALSELTSQTFFCWLNHSGASCSAAREAAAVGIEDGAIRGPEWLQGAIVDIGRDELRAMAKAA